MEMENKEGDKDGVKLVQKPRVHLDEVFKKYIGEGGKYQIFLVVILSLNGFLHEWCIF